MNLTKEHRTIHAVFDTPVETTKPVKKHPPVIGPVHFSSTFKIGLVSYCVAFTKMDDNGSRVVLYISDIDKKPEDDLVKLISKAWGRNLDYETAREFRKYFIRSSQSIIKLGNSFQVFGSLFKLMRQYADTNSPSYLSFGAFEDNRSDLYERLIKRFFPGCRYTRDSRHPQSGSEFDIYLNQGSQK